jgi:hypothetical protein
MGSGETFSVGIKGEKIELTSEGFGSPMELLYMSSLYSSQCPSGGKGS